MSYPSGEITTAEAARILGVSDTTVLAYVSKKLLRVRLLPSGHRRYKRSDVEALRDAEREPAK